MRYFFHPSFISEVRKLIRKSSYKDCEEAIINDVFKISPDDVFAHCSASRINTSPDNPLGKLRISSDHRGKSSSYRIYLLVLKVKDEMHFVFIHPKTGNKGYESISKKFQNKIIKETLRAIKEKNASEVKLNDKEDKIIYVKKGKNQNVF